MYPELLSQVKRAEIEREVAELRLVAASKRASLDRRAAAPAQRAVPSIPVRLLRALRMAS